MELVLQKKLEKNVKYGFNDKIYRISEYSDGILKKENLSGVIDYDITFECRICIPIENTVIIGKVEAINQELVMVSNGPIIVFVPKGNIDTNLWDISSNFINKNTKKVLEKNNLVKILINKVKINQNDNKIKCIGTLQEEPTEKETEEFYGVIVNNNEEDISDDNKSEDNFII